MISSIHFYEILLSFHEHESFIDTITNFKKTNYIGLLPKILYIFFQNIMKLSTKIANDFLNLLN